MTGPVTDTTAELNERFGRPPAIRFVDSALGGRVANITTPHGTATLALKGAQLLDWRPAGSEPVFWLSPMARLYAVKPARGGVPICWPWFGPASRDGLPAHGFARTADWQVDGSGLEDGRASLSLTCDAPVGQTYAAWANVAVRLDVWVGQSLRLALTTDNRSDHPVRVSEALHAYFSISDIAKVQITGLEGCKFEDQLCGHAWATQSGPITIASEIDRVYADNGPACEIRDPGLKRILRIAKQGSTTTVVWNPWSEKAARLGDVPPGSERTFVCVETANARGGTKTIEPGDTHRLVAEYSILKL